MGSAERRERERQEVRTQILDATRAILGERGYDGLTMRGVAERIEYSPAALYKHFTDREQLVRELCEADFYAFNQAVHARHSSVGMPSKKDPHAALRAIGMAYAEFALTHPEQYRVMFMTTLPHQQREENAPAEDAYSGVVHAVEAAQALGCFPGMSPHLVSQTMWGAVHGIVSIEIVHLCVTERKIPFVDITERVTATCESVLLGLEALAKQGAQAVQTTGKRRHPTTRRVR